MSSSDVIGIATFATKSIYKIGKYTEQFFSLVRTAEVVNQVNKYIVMGLAAYSVYKLMSKFVIFPLRTSLRYMWNQRKDLRHIMTPYAKGWAVVTGATYGLGMAYCKKLIEAGFYQFVLMDTDAQKMEDLKKQMIQWAFDLNMDIQSILIETIVTDMSKDGGISELKSLFQNPEERQCTLLVNNFGKMIRGSFNQLEKSRIDELIQTNMSSFTHLNQVVIQNMIHSPYQCGIINVSSATASSIRNRGFMKLQNLQVFQSTMIYQKSLTLLLQREYPQIHFLNDMPLTFNIYEQDPDTIDYIVDPEIHVDKALRDLGKVSKSYGTLRQTFMAYFLYQFYLVRS